METEKFMEVTYYVTLSEKEFNVLLDALEVALTTLLYPEEEKRLMPMVDMRVALLDMADMPIEPLDFNMAVPDTGGETKEDRMYRIRSNRLLKALCGNKSITASEAYKVLKIAYGSDLYDVTNRLIAKGFLTCTSAGQGTRLYSLTNEGEEYAKVVAIHGEDK